MQNQIGVVAMTWRKDDIRFEPYLQGNALKYAIQSLGPNPLPRVASALKKALSQVLAKQGRQTPGFTIRQWMTKEGFRQESIFIHFEVAPGISNFKFDLMQASKKKWGLMLYAEV
ncbi:hypothetical protein MBLNU459_g6499t2 [Dothideomycetes sp. NU459]